MNTRAEKPTIINFAKMTPRDQTMLRRQVAGNNGTVEVWVHPDFRREGSSMFDPPYDSPDSYKRQRDKSLNTDIRAGKPVVIFDEDRESIRRLARGKVYFVETWAADPTPKRSWERVLGELQRAGAERARISGLRFGQKEIDKWPIVSFPQPSGPTIGMDPKEALERLHNASLAIAEQQRCSLDRLNSAQWISSTRIPGHCVGLTTIAFHLAGFDTSVSKVTAP